jgi:hypothetical protein
MSRWQVDWDTKEKLIADLNEWKKKFTAVRESSRNDIREKGRHRRQKHREDLLPV